MPLVRHIQTASFEVKIWRIEEDLSFFAQAITLNEHEASEYSQISYPARKLEWMTARFVQRQVCSDSLIKDQWGKPHLHSKAGYVSIAHCKHFAAAIYSGQDAVGIDIEPIHGKVHRIAQKFLSDSELKKIDSTRSTEDLIVSWSVKEAIYKWYGKKELSFKRNIQIKDLSYESGIAKVLFSVDNLQIIKKVNFENLGEVILAFCD